jgi:hypothetical protein
MKMKIRTSRTQVDWLEGELVKLTGYEAASWVEILSDDGGKEWCRSSDLHDFTYDAKLKNQRYLYANGDCPTPVTLSGYVYKNQRGQVYYSAGMTNDEQCMNLLPANYLIKIIKREEQKETFASGFVETV